MKLTMPTRKQLVTLLAAYAAVFVVSFLAKEYIDNLLVRYNMDEIPVPIEGDRVLVFAPHNDDETLGAGELIKKSLQNGAEVKVVLATNGDGFRRAVEIEYEKINPSPADFIKYGYTRQSESLNALRLLGLSDEDVIFLGYPDGGISRMWASNWMNGSPYTSRTTKQFKTPYSNAYTKQAVYSGESLYADITALIESYKPTHIVYPHQNDRHPDHWSLNSFIKYSITVAGYKPKYEWLYLVHRGDWPTPMKQKPNMYLVPPMSLLNTGTKWHALNLTDEDIEQKSAAIKQYRTQIKRLRSLMTAFERRNELFGEYDNAKLPMAIETDSDIKPNENNYVIKDPSEDALNLAVRASLDIEGIYAEISKENNLHVFVQVRGNINLATAYHLNMIFIKAGKAVPLNLFVQNRALQAEKERAASLVSIDGIQLYLEKHIIHVIIPESITGKFSNVFINSDSEFNSYFMDRTAWRMIDAY